MVRVATTISQLMDGRRYNVIIVLPLLLFRSHSGTSPLNFFLVFFLLFVFYVIKRDLIIVEVIATVVSLRSLTRLPN